MSSVISTNQLFDFVRFLKQNYKSKKIIQGIFILFNLKNRLGARQVKINFLGEINKNFLVTSP